MPPATTPHSDTALAPHMTAAPRPPAAFEVIATGRLRVGVCGTFGWEEV